MSALRLGELCAGYGGLGMAVEEVFGATTAWFSEYDAAPSKILAYHWPTVPNYGDMTKIKWSPDCPDCGNRTAVYRRRLTDNTPFYWCSACRKEWDVAIRHADPEAHLIPEPVDIISGGTPCQDLSAAGRRAGMNEGTRSNLWVQMREAVAIQRPRYVVWENVRGAYSAEASCSVEQCQGCVGDTGDGRVFLRALGRVLGDLSDLGYDCQWRGLRAGAETNEGYGITHVGSCHARFRVFVLAANRDHIGNDGAREWAEQDRRGQSADGGNATTNSEGVRWGEGWTEPAGIIGGLHASLSSSPSAPDTDSGDDDGWLTGPFWESVKRIAAAWRSETNWGEYEPAIRRWEFVTGRPAPRPTEPTGRNNGHRLSPRFTEWMMGLPDGWITDPAIGISRNEQLKACGNGVVPQQAMAALRDMLAAFQEAEAAA